MKSDKNSDMCEHPLSPGQENHSFQLGDYQWFAIGILWVLALVLGYHGFHHHLGKEASPLRVFYLTLQLFVLESGDLVKGQMIWTLEVARILAPFVAAYTAVKALAAVFYYQFQSIRLRFMHGHTIICGLGRIGYLLALSSYREGKKVVVIEKDEGNDDIQAIRYTRGIVIIGDAINPDVLHKARINTAENIIASSGDDGINAEIGWRARCFAEHKRTGTLKCFVHIVGRHFYDLLKDNPVMTEPGLETFRLAPFNIHSLGAQEMLVEYPPFDARMDYTKSSPKTVVVAGLGRFGQAVVVEIAIRWRLICPKKKIRVVVIDREIDARVQHLIAKNPLVAQACDFVLVQLDFESEEFRKADFLTREGGPDVAMIYVCVGDDRVGLSAGLMLVPNLADHQVSIVVRTTRERGLARFIREAKGEAYDYLHAFELLDRVCKLELLGGFSEDLAVEFHNGYLQYKAMKEKAKATESSGSKVGVTADKAEERWETLPETLKLSNRHQADSVSRILSLVGYAVKPLGARGYIPATITEDDIERIAILEHERWVIDRIRDGWTLGPKDHAKKQSLYLVDWDELDKVDPGIKDYDRWWAKRLPTALKKVGYGIFKSKECGK